MAGFRMLKEPGGPSTPLCDRRAERKERLSDKTKPSSSSSDPDSLRSDRCPSLIARAFELRVDTDRMHVRYRDLGASWHQLPLSFRHTVGNEFEAMECNHAFNVIDKGDKCSNEFIDKLDMIDATFESVSNSIREDRAYEAVRGMSIMNRMRGDVLKQLDELERIVDGYYEQCDITEDEEPLSVRDDEREEFQASCLEGLWIMALPAVKDCMKRNYYRSPEEAVKATRGPQLVDRWLSGSSPL